MASRRTAGFTLVELLIVIAIIALLAGVTLVALRSARVFVGASTARQRLDDLSQALEIYKQKYGEYPPDCCATDAEIQRHILKRWPNALKSGKLKGDDGMVTIAREQMEKGPGWALLFWLAGMDAEGFLADPKEPIARGPFADDEPREEPVLELSYDSEGTGNGNWNDSGLMFNGNPIIYFRADPKTGYDGKDFHVGGAEAAPYMKNGQWYMPDSFQLIYSGDDGDFGSDPFGDEEHSGSYVAKDVNDSSTITPADKDNVTNFTGGATIESEID